MFDYSTLSQGASYAYLPSWQPFPPVHNSHPSVLPNPYLSAVARPAAYLAPSSPQRPSSSSVGSDEALLAPAKHHPLNPMDWNLNKLIPPLGVFINLLWGFGNITENQLHKNHLPKNPLSRKLAVNLPIINVVYGAVNLLGAFVQGYAIRSLSFGSFTAFSAALLPMIARYNKGLEHHLATGKLLPESIAALKKWTTLYNLVAPIGLLTGLFSITKVAQSTPNLTLEHPEGHTARHLFQEAPFGKDLPSILVRNAGQEWRSFTDALQNSGRHAVSAFKNFGQAFRNLFAPPPELADESPVTRFMKPITDGFLVPLCYAHATLGRVVASSIAALMFVGGLSLSGQAKASSALGRYLYRAMNVALLWGQVVGGTPASLFTKFNDWPVTLSMAYRTSALAYSASAVCALMNLMGKKNVDVPILKAIYKDNKLFGLDEKIWTKVGAFIQGTSYFVNLLLKSQTTDKNTVTRANSAAWPSDKQQAAQPISHHRPALESVFSPWQAKPFYVGPQ